ncbi:MAG: metallophosphoesterase [Chloroflexota bacterium]
MLIGFIGDVHGCVFQCIAAIATWQQRLGRHIDLLIQVGDLGAYPDLSRLDEASRSHLEADPSQAGFSRLLKLSGPQADAINTMCNQFNLPIYFIRGNHEDFEWLAKLPVDSKSGTATVDRFGLFRYVPDGAIMEFGNAKIAFLGGAEECTGGAALDMDVYEKFMNLTPGSIDILVTHEGPYGSSIGYHGDTHGSPLMTKLLEHLKPMFQIAGHAHCESGPERYHQTTYLGLNILVASRKWHPDAVGIEPGCLALLDTELDTLTPVRSEWFGEFEAPFNFDKWYSQWSAK